MPAAHRPTPLLTPDPRRRPALLVLALLVAVAGTWVVPAAGAEPAGVWPIGPQHRVVHGFDPPAHPWQAGHRGVDLAGRVGQEVRAARAGTVTFAGRLAGRGVVVVRHGARRTTYEPVAALVGRGEVIPAGAVIGRLELAGSHCLPVACLHWGLVEGKDHYLDPLTLVGAGPVRLLPLDGAVAGPASRAFSASGSGPLLATAPPARGDRPVPPPLASSQPSAPPPGASRPGFLRLPDPLW